MNKTKIEWTDYTWNPITGCLHGCPYCYARKIAERFHKGFPFGFKPHFHKDRLQEPFNLSGHWMIFTVSMGDILGDWVPQGWIDAIMDVIRKCPKHQFQVLTKAPWNIYKLGKIPFNCWVGTSLTGEEIDIRERISNVIKRDDGEFNIRFASFEPLHAYIPRDVSLKGLNWLIMGLETNPLKPIDPKIIEELMDRAIYDKCKVFLKDSIVNNIHVSRTPQEWPEILALS
jgi:protein gp37